jgi:hypothetical protein
MEQILYSKQRTTRGVRLEKRPRSVDEVFEEAATDPRPDYGFGVGAGVVGLGVGAGVVGLGVAAGLAGAVVAAFTG